MLLDIKPLLTFTSFVYIVTAASSFLIGAEADSIRNAQTSFLENAKSGMRFISKSSVLGPFAARHIKQFRLVLVGLSLHYASFAALGMCKNYFLSLAIIAASYMVFYITLVTMHSVRDHVTAVGIRGSVYGTVTTLLTPPAILSMLAGSYLTDQFSVSAVLFASGLCAMVSLYLILFFSRGKRFSGIRAE